MNLEIILKKLKKIKKNWKLTKLKEEGRKGNLLEIMSLSISKNQFQIPHMNYNNFITVFQNNFNELMKFKLVDS